MNNIKEKDKLIIKTWNLLRKMFEHSRGELSDDDLILIGTLNLHPTIQEFKNNSIKGEEERVNRFID